MSIITIYKDCNVLYSKLKNSNHSDIICLDYITPFIHRNDVPFICIEHDISIISFFTRAPSTYVKMTIDYDNKCIIYDTHKNIVYFDNCNSYVRNLLFHLQNKINFQITCKIT